MPDSTAAEEKRLIKAFGADSVVYAGHAFAVHFLGRTWKVPFGLVTLRGIAAIKKQMKEATDEA